MKNFLSLPLKVIEDVLAQSESLVVWTLVSKDLRHLVYTSTGLKAAWLVHAYLRAKQKIPQGKTCWLDRNSSGYDEDLDDFSSDGQMPEEIIEEEDAELLFLYWRQYMGDCTFEEDVTTYRRWVLDDQYHKHWFISQFSKIIPRYTEFLTREVAELLKRQYENIYNEIFDSVLLASIRNNNPDVMKILLRQSPDPYVVKRLPLAYAVGEGAREVTQLMLQKFRVKFTMCHAIACIKEGDLDSLEWMMKRSLNRCDIWDGNFCGFMRALGISLSKGVHQAIRLILNTLVCSNGLSSFGLHRWVMYPTHEQSLNPEPWKSILRQICFCSCDVETFEFTITMCADISQIDVDVWREQALLCSSKSYPRYFTQTLVKHLLSNNVDPNVSEGLALWNVGSNFTNGEYFEYEMRTYAAIPIDVQKVDRNVYLELAKCLIRKGLRVTEKLIGKFVSDNHRRFLELLHAEHKLPLTTQPKSLLSIALDAHIMSGNMIQFLLDNDVSVDSSHFLHSVTKGRLDVVQLLYYRLQHIERATLSQALEIAVKCMHLEIVNFLLEHEASMENLLNEFCISYPRDGSYIDIQGKVKFHEDYIYVDLTSKKWSLETPRDEIFFEILKALGSTWSKTQKIPNVTLLICAEEKSDTYYLLKKIVLS